MFLTFINLMLSGQPDVGLLAGCQLDRQAGSASSASQTSSLAGQDDLSAKPPWAPWSPCPPERWPNRWF